MEQDLLYFNTAANGIMDSNADEALQEFYSEMKSNPSSYFMKWMMNSKEKLRSQMASLINSSENELAAIPNSSFGISSFCQSLPKSFKVLMLDDDYPSLYEPFRLQGFNMHSFNSSNGYDWDYDKIEDVISSKNINILAVSHIQYLSGYLCDLDRLGGICKKYNTIFMVDGTQSLGAESIDIVKSNIDVFVASNYKWMNAGLGSGIIHISEQLLNQYPPKLGGFGSYVLKDNKFEYESGIKSYEPGHMAIATLLVLENVLKTRNKEEVLKIKKHNTEVANYFRKQLENHQISFVGQGSKPESHSAIVSVHQNLEDFEKIKANNVECSFRGNRIRYSFHKYNTKAEVDEYFRRLISNQ